MSNNNEKIFPDKLCLIPFTGLNIHPTGEWQLCPSSRKKTALNPEESLSSIFKGKTLNSVRETMLAGREVVPDCSSCHKLEKEGVESRRTRFNKKKLKIYGRDLCYNSVYEKEKKLLELDISFSNLCNLDCVTCNSDYSSSWIKKDHKAVSEGLSWRNGKKKTWQVNKSFIDSFIGNSLEDIKLVFIKGGEPLIDSGCLYFLKKLSELKKERLIVYVQTNGTIMDSRVISAIKNLNTEVSFSVDGLKAHYNWIRGFNFSKMMKNFEQLNTVKSLKHSYFNYTVSAFNFHRIPDFIEFFMEEKKKYPKLRRLSFTIAHQSYLNFRVFNREAREEIKQKIQETVKDLNVEEDFLDSYTALLQELSMEKLNESAIQNFQKWLSFCNSMRKKNLQDIDSLFKKLLKEAL